MSIIEIYDRRNRKGDSGGQNHGATLRQQPINKNDSSCCWLRWKMKLINIKIN